MGILTMSGLSPSGQTLLLCGVVVLLTAVVHVFVTLLPLRAGGRCIFLRQRAGLGRLLSGEMSPGLSLFWGLLLTLVTTTVGGVLRFSGVGQALLAGPVPGLLFTVWVVVASLRHLTGHWLLKVLLSALVSLCLLSACLLILLIHRGAGWHLPLQP